MKSTSYISLQSHWKDLLFYVILFENTFTAPISFHGYIKTFKEIYVKLWSEMTYIVRLHAIFQTRFYELK